jgi:hypothetical protein
MALSAGPHVSLGAVDGMRQHAPLDRSKISPIATKLTVSMLILTLLLVVTGGVGIWGMNRIQNTLNSVITQQIAKVRAINAMKLDFVSSNSNAAQLALATQSSPSSNLPLAWSLPIMVS